MASLGQKFKATREKKRATLSQAAAATRLKVQHLEAMEKDEFGRIPAPAYAKGFIKLYAEYLGLDPAPMIKEYVELYANKPRQAKPLEEKKPASRPIQLPKPDFEKLQKQGLELIEKLNLRARWKPIVSVLGVVLVLIVVARFARRDSSQMPEPTLDVVEQETPDRKVEKEIPKRPMTALLSEPAEPYVDKITPIPVTP